jgi:predicted Zn-dependent peptidase
MKKILYLFVLVAPITLWSQNIDRTKAPQPGKAPIIQVASPVKYTLSNGLQVFVVKNTKLPRVTATLAFNLDGFKEGNKAGLADMAGQLLKRGTTTKTKAELDESVEYLGGSLSTSSTSASVSSLKNNFPKLMSLLSEVVLHPALSTEELEKVRKQSISNIESNKDDADAIANNVVNKLVYGPQHAFGEITTVKTINAVTVEDVKQFFATQWSPTIAYLVFVGDIEPIVAKQLAEKNFGSWIKREVSNQNFEKSPKPSQTYVAIVDRPASVQSVVTIATPIDLVKGAPDEIPANVMNNILGGGFSGRLFANLREQHGFTYGAYSSVKPNKFIGMFSAEASVRNEKTDSSIQEILFEMNRIKKEKVGEEELARMKNYLAGGFARSLENPATVANFALNIVKYNLPSDYYQKYLTNLASVNAEQIQSVANKFLTTSNMHIVVVGNAKQVAKGLEKYGKIKYFDMEGNEVAAPTEAKAVDATLTSEVLLEKIIAAKGADKDAGIKDLQLTGKVSIMGQSLNIRQVYVAPGNTMQSMSMGGMELSKQSLIDGKYEMMQQGKSLPIKEEIKENLDESASLIEEKLYKAKAYKFNIVGMEKLNDKDVIHVELVTPSGKKSDKYYDIQTYLLLKSSTVQEVPGRAAIVQQTFYNEYTKVNGVQVAKDILIDMGPMKMNVKYEEVKFNQGLSTADMK